MKNLIIKLIFWIGGVVAPLLITLLMQTFSKLILLEGIYIPIIFYTLLLFFHVLAVTITKKISKYKPRQIIWIFAIPWWFIFFSIALTPNNGFIT